MNPAAAPLKPSSNAATILLILPACSQLSATNRQPMYNPPQSDPNHLQASIKNTLGVRIVPKPDKYYLIEAVSDPRGKQTRTVTTTSVDGAP